MMFQTVRTDTVDTVDTEDGVVHTAHGDTAHMDTDGENRFTIEWWSDLLSQCTMYLFQE